MAVELWALTTLATVKDELGISDDSEDTRLTRLIHAWSRRFNRETNRKLARASYTEKIRGQGMNRIRVAQYPIVSVDAVSVDDVVIVEGTDFEVLAEDGVLVREEPWRWAVGAHLDLTSDPDPYSSRLNVTVTYTAGYITPAMADDDDSLTRDLPEDLEDGCIQGVVFSYTNSPGVKSEQTPGGHRRELFGDQGILATLEPLWADYRKHDRSDGA